MKPRKSIIIAPLVQLQIVHKEQLFHNCSWNHENDEIKISIEYLTNLKSSLLLIASLDKDFSQLFLITSLDDPPFFFNLQFQTTQSLVMRTVEAPVFSQLIARQPSKCCCHVRTIRQIHLRRMRQLGSMHCGAGCARITLHRTLINPPGTFLLSGNENYVRRGGFCPSYNRESGALVLSFFDFYHSISRNLPVPWFIIMIVTISTDTG